MDTQDINNQSEEVKIESGELLLPKGKSFLNC